MEVNDLTFSIGGADFNFFQGHMIVYIERVRWIDGQYVSTVCVLKKKNATYPLKVYLGEDEKIAKEKREEFYKWWIRTLIYHKEKENNK